VRDLAPLNELTVSRPLEVHRQFCAAVAEFLDRGADAIRMVSSRLAIGVVLLVGVVITGS